jgi:Fe-S oxidoreductase
MMAAIDPEKSTKMRRKRLEDFPEDRTIASNCEGCLGAFRSEGRKAIHLLELLFGKSKARGWGNRIKTTLK